MTTTLSINLSDNLAKASQEAAGKMGISRTEFIRQAIAHEVTQFQVQLEEEAIVKSMMAMKQSKRYFKEANDLIEGLSTDLPEDEEEWWSKK